MGEDLKRLRVVVGGMPRLLRDIVEDIVRSQADMEIRDWTDDMAAALERRHADVVILQDAATDQPGPPARQPRWGGQPGPPTRHRGPQRGSRAGVAHPRWGGQVADKRLVIVTYSERDSGASSFRPLSIAELSPQALVQAIREACALSAS